LGDFDIALLSADGELAVFHNNNNNNDDDDDDDYNDERRQYYTPALELK